MNDEELLNQLSEDIHNFDMKMDKRFDALDKKIEIGFSKLDDHLDEHMDRVLKELDGVMNKINQIK